MCRLCAGIMVEDWLPSSRIFPRWYRHYNWSIDKITTNTCSTCKHCRYSRLQFVIYFLFLLLLPSSSGGPNLPVPFIRVISGHSSSRTFHCIATDSEFDYNHEGVRVMRHEGHSLAAGFPFFFLLIIQFLCVCGCVWLYSFPKPIP